MSGAVLDKSDQDLQDIAAYFASQSGCRRFAGPVGGPRTPGVGGPAGSKGSRGSRTAPMNFDHGDRDSEYTSMLARARLITPLQSEMPDDDLCSTLDSDAAPERDDDNDGLAEPV